MEPSKADRGAQDLRLDEGFFAAKDDLRLYWRALRPARAESCRASVAVVHGYGDHSGRYRELLERLARAGYAAHAFDYRGHGQSDGRRAHVEHFSEYLDDLDVFFEHVKQASEGKPIFLMGHSLGGLISATWALGRQQALAGLALSSPFVGFAFQPPWTKVLLAKALDQVAPWLPVANELKPEQLTADPQMQRATERDPLYLHVATARWYRETCAAQVALEPRAGELRLPCLVLLGESDPIASPAAIRRFVSGLGSRDKTLQAYPGLLHEVLNEARRAEVFSDLLAWLDRRAPAAGATSP